MSSALVSLYREKEFSEGYNPVIDEGKDPTKIGLGVYRLKKGQEARVGTKGREVALIAFSGKGVFHFGGDKLPFKRGDWENEAPAVVHVSSGTELGISARENAEVILCSIANPDPFETRSYLPRDVRSELRGAGTLRETATRIVRTAFDIQNAPKASRMVLGEVINFPGRWSSYPPHRHVQPEVYFYRFKLKQGYGHGELGEEVFKVRDRDLLRITDSRGHSQASAPGYAMYYLWAVRHLPGNPYTGFQYYPEHEWTLKAK
jgi:5-deoxy-glucuronate isomerase